MIAAVCVKKAKGFLVVFQLQRRMKIAELKQICSRPDVVEVVIFNCALLASSYI